MEQTVQKSKVWIYVVVLLALGGIGTAIWFFFFRKESAFQKKAAAKNASNESTNQSTPVATPKQDFPKSDTTPKHETTPKVDSPKVTTPKTGNVYEDIFLKHRKDSIAKGANRNAMALVQHIANVVTGGTNTVDGYFGPKTKTAINAAINKIRGKSGINYLAQGGWDIGAFITLYVSSKNLVLNASEDDIKEFLSTVPPEKVFK